MKKHISVSVIIPVILFCTSCKKWLDVKPRDKVIENVLLENEEGFITALNGVYLDMTGDRNYGGQMTMQMTEVLGQRYNVGGSHNLYKLASYQYTDPQVQSMFTGTWSAMYKMVANVNKILSVIDQKKSLFSGDHYQWVKGEALALRAMIQFDLFRLFGPVYSKDSTALSLPYYSSFTTNYEPYQKGNNFLEKVLADLDAAEVLLTKDPVLAGVTLGADSDAGEGSAWNYRNLRLNYFAVKALKARVYLYRGDKISALKYAREVISNAGVFFPFVKFSDLSGDPKNPDRVFSSELLFALQDSRRNDKYKAYFDPGLKDNEILYTESGRLSSEFGNNANDYRYYNTWMIPGSNQKSYRCYYKYADVEEPAKRFRNLIPMIRLSEMYFIAAECEQSPDAAIAYLNEVRKNRGAVLIAPGAGVPGELLKDYRREFYGEGQMFFYYKRTFTAGIPGGTGSGTVAMTKERYVLPIPLDESQFRN